MVIKKPKWKVGKVCGPEKFGIRKVVKEGRLEMSAGVNTKWVEVETRSDSRKEKYCSWKQRWRDI